MRGKPGARPTLAAVGDLDLDTRLTGGDGTYVGALSEDWAIWGPNGGYVAAVLLRAAGAHSELPRPASIAVTFLARGEFAPVQLTTRTLRRTRRAEAVAVSMAQDGRAVAEAVVWFTLDDLPGLEHDVVPMPDVPPASDLPTAAERMAAQGRERPHPFFDNMDQHAVDWTDRWPPAEALPPRTDTWFRFRPTERFDDPVVDAGRLLVVLDTMGWPAAYRHHAWAWPDDDVPWVAPSLDLHVRFHRPSGHSPLLFVRTEAPVSTGGLLTAEGRVWSEQGELLASMASQLLCTPTR